MIELMKKLATEKDICVDLRSCNIVFQYSYSHDNSHGLFWNCTVQSDSGIICRYNISQNDRGIIFCVNYPVTSAYIYNNTVYIGPGLSPKIISERRQQRHAVISLPE